MNHNKANVREERLNALKPSANGEAELVQTEHFRCMAYLDHSGAWRSFYGGERLQGRISVVPFAQR